MKKRVFAVFCAMVLVLSGCGKKDGTEENNENTTQKNTGTSTSEQVDIADMFTERDYEVTYDEANSAVIQLDGSSASCDSDAVQISGSTVTITDEGTYILRGTLDDGMIIVNAGEKDKPQIVLDNVSITSKTSAPIYILEADKVFVTMAEGSTNTLANGGTFTAIDENNIDAAIFSKQDLTMNGEGNLTVTSPIGHGIVSKDDLVFTSGTYIVDSASQGLDANDSVRIVNATFTVSSGKDGIHAENSEDTSLGFIYIASGTFDIAAEGDGISASAYMQIDDGEYKIIAGGGSANATKQSSDSWGDFGGGRGGMGGGPGQMGGGRGDMGGGPGQMGGGRGDMGGHPGQMGAQGSVQDATTQSGATSQDSTEDDSSTSIKGIKSARDLTINGGTFTIDAADDAVHSNASVYINGGTYEIATGDDGVHADETLTVADGTINITESYEGLEGLHINISGGDMKLVASDDGLNAAGGTDSSGTAGPRGNDQFGGGGSASNGSITISGGTLFINASGDGVDSNGTLAISGGTTTVCGPTSGDTAVLDYDSSATITGGTFIGTGAIQMAQSFSSSEQGVIAVNVGSQAAGTTISLKDADGKEVISYAPELQFSLVILSSPDIVTGENYTITVGSASGEFTAE